MVDPRLSRDLQFRWRLEGLPRLGLSLSKPTAEITSCQGSMRGGFIPRSLGRPLGPRLSSSRLKAMTPFRVKSCGRAAGDTMPCCACCSVMVLPHCRCSQPRPVPFFSSFFSFWAPDPAFFNPPAATRPRCDGGTPASGATHPRPGLPGQQTQAQAHTITSGISRRNVFDRPTETFSLCRACIVHTCS